MTELWNEAQRQPKDSLLPWTLKTKAALSRLSVAGVATVASRSPFL